MSQLDDALKALTQALAELEHKLSEINRQSATQHKELKQVNEICAHLRAEVSGLKKDLKRQIAVNEKAGREIDSVLADIDNALEQANG